MHLKIDIDDAEARRLFADITQRATDLSPVMRAVSEILRDGVAQAFQDEADPNTGEKWAALSPVTIAQRQKAGHSPGRILQQKGQLAASMTADFGPDFAAAGTNLAYAITHQLGAKKGAFGRTARGAPIPWGDIPARPFLGLSEDTKHEISDRVSRYLAGI